MTGKQMRHYGAIIGAVIGVLTAITICGLIDSRDGLTPEGWFLGLAGGSVALGLAGAGLGWVGGLIAQLLARLDAADRPRLR